jgi:cyclase
LPGTRPADHCFAGNLIFNDGAPCMLMGSVRGCAEALQRIRQFQTRRHRSRAWTSLRPPCAPPAGAYCEFVEQLADEIGDGGTSPPDAAHAADLGEFAGLTDPERLVGQPPACTVRAARRRARRHRTSPQAIVDILHYNGGRPLRCLA